MLLRLGLTRAKALVLKLPLPGSQLWVLLLVLTIVSLYVI